MNFGLYSIFLGMRARQSTLDAQANNIANASTAGFKAERLFYSSTEANTNKPGETKHRPLIGVSTSTSADFSEGSIEQTTRKLDVALKGGGFLQIQTPQGMRLTRAGNLNVNSNGQLVTRNGGLVVGQNGPITVPPDAEVSIAADGTMSANGAVFDQLKVVCFNNPAAALAKDGESAFIMTGIEVPQADAGTSVIQGALEGSNVNSIKEMVSMMNNNREFESLQKSLTLLMHDLGKKISSEIGRLS